jgi:hypothetical protein
MFPIRPEVIPGTQLAQMAGADYTCPYCHAQSVRETDVDTGWVVCLMRSLSAQWICLGCFEDIYSTCLSIDYVNHPYRDIVQNAAKLDGLDEKTYRLACLKHQLAILESSEYPPNPHTPSLEYLERLIAELER